MNDILVWILSFAASLVMAPILPGIINKVKSLVAGRRGPPIFQQYRDIAKLLRKGRVYSSTTSGVFRIAPVLSLAALVVSAVFVPFSTLPSPFSFGGDVVLFFYLAGLSRMVTVLGALDTGSSFEGMGASREVEFSSMAELSVFAVLAALAALTKSWCMAGILGSSGSFLLTAGAVPVILAALAVFVVILAECCRVPFDDPETHLELTMIHEAMILDNSGPDLAFIFYGSSLKMWILSSFLVMMFIPSGRLCIAGAVAVYFVGVLFVAVLIGAVESFIGRFRFLKVPQMFFGALAAALLAVILSVSMEIL